jgi:spermidine synthase
MLALLLLFVGSGCAALIYEVVWFQLLQLSIGSSAVSVGVLLAAFMGGMALGSLLLPRIKTHAHPLRVYAVIELGIASLGIVALFAVPAVGRGYALIAGTGVSGLVLRAMVAGICLVPPAALMGATLPAVARLVRATPRGLSWLGLFYGGNLAGAVLGTVIAGFYLLPGYDTTVATLVAAVINVVVAAAALVLARGVPQFAPAEPISERAEYQRGATRIYAAVALSGATALGAEVIWTRTLALMFGATVYAFSIILAVFLVGLGLGSVAGAAIAKHTARPREALGWCQVGICVCLAWAAWTLNASLPYWPVDPLISSSPVFAFQVDLARAAWVMLPGATLWGASFPLALAGFASGGQETARLVGRVYAANTAGAIAGALLTGLVLVNLLGTQTVQRILIGIAAVSGMLMFTSAGAERGSRIARVPLAAGVSTVVALACVLVVPPVSGLLVAYGRFSASWVGQTEIVEVAEGVTASIALSRTRDGKLSYHNSGKIQASSELPDMRAQRMLGHLATLVPRTPGTVLVIGCGAGVTAGAVSIDPLVARETIAEIEPLVPRMASTYFAPYNFDVVRNPKVTLRLDDARHYLLTTNETFDAITSDPLDPWFKGSATLFTREFFESVKRHLNPGGVVTLWMQLYEMSEAAVKSELATFFEVFPHGAVFANTINGGGYDLVLLGQLERAPLDVDRVQARLADPANSAVARSLAEVGIQSAVDLFATYAGRSADLQGWLRGAAINTDRTLRLQYLAGRGLNLYESNAIFREMIRSSRYPHDLFVGNPETLTVLQERIERTLASSAP